MEKVKILLIGAGAVGVYFSGRLAQAGAEVAVVARSDYETVKNAPYHVRSIAGDFDFRPHRVLRSAAEYQDVPDYIIVASKVLPDVDLPSMFTAKDRKTTIVLIQNGINIEAPVAEAFPNNELLSTIAYIGVSRPARGELLHLGGGTLRMGVYPRGISPKAEALAEMFARCGVQCELCEDIVLIRWVKLLWNLPFNTVSVLAGGADTRRMVDDRELKNLCWQLMLEVVKVANAGGIQLTLNHAREQMEYTEKFPSYRTSMLQDFAAGRALEVEAIVGNLLRMAREKKIAVPHVESCYALLRSVNEIRQTGRGDN